MRRVAGFCGMVLCLGVHPAFALGLGSIQVHSHLNEPFSATIPVTTGSAGELDSSTVTLASQDEFQRANVAYSDYLPSLQFSLNDQASPPVVEIKSDRIEREPYLNFLVQVRWKGGVILREYTVLLDPVGAMPAAVAPTPTYAAPPAPAPAMAAPSESSPPASVTPPPVPPPVSAAAAPRRHAHAHAHAPAPAAAMAAPAASPATAASSAAAPAPAPGHNTYGPVAPGETLWSVATKVRSAFPDVNLNNEQVCLALFKANPEAFDGGKIDGLHKGRVLRIPAVGDMTALPADAARARFRALLHKGAAAPAAASSSAQTAPLPMVPAVKAAKAAPPPPAMPATPALPLGKAPPPPSPAPAPAVPKFVMTPPAATPAGPKLAPAPAPPKVSALAPPPAPAPAPAAPVMPPKAAVVTPPPAPVVVPPPAAPTPPPAPKAPAMPAGPSAMAPLIPASPAPPTTIAPNAAVSAASIAKPASAASLAKPASAASAPKPLASPLVPASPTAANPPAEAPGGGLPLMPIIGAGLVLFLAMVGLNVLRRRRKPAGAVPAATDPFGVPAQSSSGSAAKPASEHPESSADGALENLIAATGAHEAASAPAAAEANDPLADADFHIAYGLFDEASTLLKRAIEHSPGRVDLQEKLAEVYAAARKPADFERVVDGLRGKLGANEGARIAALREKLTASAGGGAAAAPAHAEPAPAPTWVPPEPPRPSATEPPARSGLSVDLSDFDAEHPAAPPPAAKPADNRIDFSFDEPTKVPPPPAAAPPPAPVRSTNIGDPLENELATKLDLARAYSDMGDNDAARSLLQEVLASTSPAHRAEAEELLGRLGS